MSVRARQLERLIRGVGCGLLLVMACDSRGRASGPKVAEASAATPTRDAQASGDQPSTLDGPIAVGDEDEGEDADEGDDTQETTELEELEELEEPGPPEDYGQVSPSDPPPAPETLTVHALAGYEVVAVYDKPDIESPRLGYIRIGQRMMVTPKIEGAGCPKGWYGLAQGGYACASKGLVVDATRPPYMHKEPTPPRVDQALPYDYAYVRRWNSPMWWRVPSSKELAVAAEQRAIREAQRQGLPAPGSEPSAKPPEKKPETPAEGGEQAEALPSVTDEPEKPKPPEPKPEAPANPPPTPASDSPGEQDKPTVKLPLNPDKPWLERGYYISLAEKFSDGGHAWWRTARNGYVSASDAYPYGTKDFEGAELSEEQTFPFGFVMTQDGTRLYELVDDDKLKAAGKLERRTFVDLTEELEIRGKAYMMTADGHVVRKDHIRMAEPQPLPDGLEPWERWISVSLSKQMLVAYEGTKPVYVTLVSTGRKGPPEDPFETPKGRWRVRSKHISTTMDGDTASDGSYSIMDVPWTMFFEGSYALHGAFWHEGFGRVRSHGCVNLGPTDARWLFYWAPPFLPEGWHGVHAHKGSPGTTVVVHD
jgi:hypothetical protein